MTRVRLTAAALIAGFALPLRPAVAQPVLTDITLFGTSVFGEYTGGPAWNTRAGDALPTVFLSPHASAAFVPDDVLNPAAALALPIPVGSTTLYYYASGGFFGFYGLNLFFDGATTPDISAFASFGTGRDPNPALCTLSPTGACTPGANTFSFVTASGYTVMLSSYVLQTDAAGNGGSIDLVGPLTTVPDGELDNHARLVLQVTPPRVVIPEPATLALTLGGGVVLALAGWRRRREG